MKISFIKYPLDLILCFLWSGILAPLAFFNIENPVRLILGIPFILFIPGYVLVSALFPFKNQGESISCIERIGLSLGISVAIVPLIGLALNFSPWGIRLQPLLLLLIFFIFSVGLIAFYRWSHTIPEERFSFTFNISPPKSESRINEVLSLILVAVIVISIILLAYVLVVPTVGEKFTEFYILGPNGKADQYPQNLSIGQNASVILGIANHEYRTINYIVEIWLVNQTNYYNSSTGRNETMVHHMWFLDIITVELNHTPVNIDTPNNPQWEHNYSFSIDQKGNFKLVFLLFTSSSNYQYGRNVDFVEMADQILNNPYRELHLWITIQ
jgi:uncharacterized membrane protein